MHNLDQRESNYHSKKKRFSRDEKTLRRSKFQYFLALWGIQPIDSKPSDNYIEINSSSRIWKRPRKENWLAWERERGFKGKEQITLREYIWEEGDLRLFAVGDKDIERHHSFVSFARANKIIIFTKFFGFFDIFQVRTHRVQREDSRGHLQETSTDFCSGMIFLHH